MGGVVAFRRAGKNTPAIAPQATTIVDTTPADRFIASLYRHPGSLCVQVVFRHAIAGHREAGA
jgi:hypothetical protein